MAGPHAVADAFLSRAAGGTMTRLLILPFPRFAAERAPPKEIA